MLKKRKTFIILTLISLLTLSLACQTLTGTGASTPSISNIYLAKDSDGIQTTNTFDAQDVIYCIVELENTQSDTMVKAGWTAVSIEGEEPNLFIGEKELNSSGGNVVTFDLSNDNLWPAGQYKVDIYLNGVLNRTLEFSIIQGAQSNQPAQNNGSAAYIGDAYLTEDDAGTRKTTVFAPESIIYAVVLLENAPADTGVKAVWTAVNVEGEDPNTFLTETELTSGSDTLTFNLSNDMLWPAGQYKVDIYLNNTLNRTLEFSVP